MSEREQSIVQVSPYDNTGFKGGWSGRSRGFWGTSATGLAYGGLIIGPAVAMIPAVVGVTPFSEAAATIPTSMAVFGAVGMTTGFAIGATVGAPAGAAAAVAEEQERRMRERDIALGISTPELEAAITRRIEAKKDSSTVLDKASRFNWKVGATFAALGLVGGAVMAAAYFALGGVGALPAMGTLLGSAASSPTAVTAYFMGVMGIFGGLFGASVPDVATHMQSHAGEMLSGERKLGTSGILTPELSVPGQAQEAPPPSVTQESRFSGSAVAQLMENGRSASYQDLLSRQSASTATEITGNR